MVTVTGYRIVETDDNDTYIRLILSGSLTLVRSKETGRHYATVRKCSISSTFDEQTAKLMLGQQLPGTRCCFDFDYCFGDPTLCTTPPPNGPGYGGGFEYHDLATHINGYLAANNDPGNAHIVVTTINDPNYPCRNVILRIDNTKIEFTNLMGEDANSGAFFNCSFVEECN